MKGVPRRVLQSDRIGIGRSSLGLLRHRGQSIAMIEQASNETIHSIAIHSPLLVVTPSFKRVTERERKEKRDSLTRRPNGV